MKNDALEKVEDETLQGLKDLGACGLQIPMDYGKLGIAGQYISRGAP